MTTDPPRDDRRLLAELLVPPTGGDPSEPPADEALFAYLAGDLPEDDADRVRAWVAAHPEAADRLLEMEAFASAAPPPSGVADLETRSAWRDFERRRDAETAAALPAVVTAPRPVRWPLAVAAVLLLTTAGLAWRVLQLERASRQPVANLRTLTLLGEVRSGGQPETFTIAPGEPFRVAVFPAPLPAGCDAYDAVLHLPDGTARRLAGLRPDAHGRLDLLLPGETGPRILELAACGDPRGRFRFLVVAE